MRFTVRRLRDRGRRLSLDEIQQSEFVTGRLWVRDVRQQITQVTVMADLWDGGTPERRLLGPLMNPHIVRWDLRGLLLAGFEIAAEHVDGTLVSHEHGQTWWLIPEGGQWLFDEPTKYPRSTQDVMDRKRIRKQE